MEQNRIAPTMQFSTPPTASATATASVSEGGVDGMDVEAITRKRARSRIDARRKFRIVASTVVACSRFRIVLEVDAHGAEKPEQAHSEVLAALSSRARLEEQSASDGAVVACGHAGECTTYTDGDGGERARSAPYEQVVKEMFTEPNAGSAFLYESNQLQDTIEGEENIQYEQGIQHVQNLLDEPDMPSDGLQNPPSVWSDWGSIQNLVKANESSRQWMDLASGLSDEITRKIQDLEAGAGRDKLHKMVEEAKEIVRKIDKQGEFKKTHRAKTDAKALSTSATVREVEQFFGELLEEMHSHVKELSGVLLGRQMHLKSVTALGRLIENGRKAMSNLRRGTDWISDKLDKLVNDLGKRERTVDRHFQKCAESILTLVQSFLQQREGNFVSMASVTDWMFAEQSSRLLADSKL